jgi:hypothetical protein
LNSYGVGKASVSAVGRHPAIAAGEAARAPDDQQGGE